MSLNSNSRRFDLSPYLIHFFRELDCTKPDCPPLPEHWGFGNVEHDVKFPPFFLMRSAVRNLRLWPTWSVRGHVRTIYGNSPAICFTEMPIAAFLEAGKSRRQLGQHMSPYGLVFPKEGMFKEGARPVIYGLSGDVPVLASGGKAGARIIDPAYLPLMEQFRYVTFNPTSARSVDWTHEREWRWPFRGSLQALEEHLNEYGTGPDVSDYPGLELNSSNMTGMGAIVSTANEASQLIYDILWLIDSELIEDNQFRFVISTHEIDSTDQIQSPEAMDALIERATIDIGSFLEIEKAQAAEIAAEFHQLVAAIEKSSSKPEGGEFGGCWLWLADNRSKLTRALIQDECVEITDSGRYLVRLYEYNDSRSLSQREEMTKALCVEIKKRFGVDCAYYSVLGSDDPNSLPFYTEPDFEWDFFNVAWEGLSD